MHLQQSTHDVTAYLTKMTINLAVYISVMDDSALHVCRCKRTRSGLTLFCRLDGYDGAVYVCDLICSADSSVGGTKQWSCLKCLLNAGTLID